MQTCRYLSAKFSSGVWNPLCATIVLQQEHQEEEVAPKNGKLTRLFYCPNLQKWKIKPKTNQQKTPKQTKTPPKKSPKQMKNPKTTTTTKKNPQKIPKNPKSYIADANKKIKVSLYSWFKYSKVQVERTAKTWMTFSRSYLNFLLQWSDRSFLNSEKTEVP